MLFAIILALFLILILIRVPIAFAMLITAAVYLLAADISLVLLAQKVAGGVDSFSLLAVPLFLLAGFLMNTMGITERIFAFAGALVRHIPGGLGHVNVLASVIFAGMSGSIIADAGGLGAVEIKAMREAGYRDRFSAAITAASALIGPIIPPSIIMVIYAFVTEVSVGRLFLAGVIPGLLMAGSMMILIYFLAKTGREVCPVLPRADFKEVLSTFHGAILPILAPLILIGGIMSGIFTPTEAGVVAVVYVLIVGLFLLKFSWRHIVHATAEAATATAATLFIIACAAIFTWIVSTANIPQIFSEFVSGWVTTQAGVFMVIIISVLLLGTVMEGLPILIVFGPLFLAIATNVGIDPIHLGIVFIMSIMIGGITPPVGITLYVVMAIAKVPLPDFMRSIWPFYFAIVAVIILLVFFPALCLWLPDMAFG
ncbi:MAG: ABC transporter permease [Sneathiella sp.]|jgi:tripartite ATP-independent transporter DctM subunit|uniref:TRAP transporter large permease n=1 Tax=Sneathiella sp. TaxID=1964365 RepID=UPI000C6084AB|nr:TRAP transporter large permease [Sneathiella sp.]MAL80696.1 ABC transporter permease [Sneathiella sp.]